MPLPGPGRRRAAAGARAAQPGGARASVAAAGSGEGPPRRRPAGKPRARYDDELVALRDEIGEARLEDVPALVAQMERLQGVSLTRGDLQTILVDPASPYFGHLRLREQVRGRGAVERDVLIGRATFVDAAAASTSSTGGTRPSASSSIATPRGATTRSASAIATSRARSWRAGR